MSRLLFFQLLALCLSFFFVNSNGNDGDSFGGNCPSQMCGDVNISYPFWLQADTTLNDHCGYPGFGVNCSRDADADGDAILHISNEAYSVTKIDYTRNALTLVDMDVTSSSNGECPRVLHNLTLDSHTVPLYYSHELVYFNLNFYYNCTTPPVPLPSGIFRIDCLDFGVSKSSYVSINPNSVEPVGFDWLKYCEKKVVAPVLTGREINNDDHDLIGGLHRTMNEGFLLNWQRMMDCDDCDHREVTVRECDNCEQSDGLCGYEDNMTGTQRFVCFCSDGSRKIDHCRGFFHRYSREGVSCCVTWSLQTKDNVQENIFEWPSTLFMNAKHIYVCKLKLNFKKSTLGGCIVRGLGLRCREKKERKDYKLVCLNDNVWSYKNIQT